MFMCAINRKCGSTGARMEMRNGYTNLLPVMVMRKSSMGQQNNVGKKNKKKCDCLLQRFLY